MMHAMLALGILEVSGYPATSKWGKNLIQMKYPGCRHIQLISLDRDLPQAKRLQVVEEINYPSNSLS